MGLKMTPHCDVFDTTRNVKHYRVVLFMDVMGKDEVEWSHEVYLSPRGLRRFDKFVARGMTAPNRDDKQGDEEGDTDANTG